MVESGLERPFNNENAFQAEVKTGQGIQELRDGSYLLSDNTRNEHVG